MKTMDRKRKYLILCPVLVVLWLFPLLYGGGETDAGFWRSAAAYLLFLPAALCCILLPNRLAALLSAAAVGAGLCVLQPSAVYDVLPVLLLCGWLRCLRDFRSGQSVRVYLEILTDLIYAWLVAAVVRLFRSGYAFIRIEKADDRTIPELCLTALVFLFFAVLFFTGFGDGARQSSAKKADRKKTKREERGVVGLIPTPVTSRAFCGLCALLLAVCVLLYTNRGLLEENALFLRSGFRLLFFPWMVLLFLVLDSFFPSLSDWKRLPLFAGR